MDIHEAMQIGELKKNSEAIKVVRPDVDRAIFPNAITQERVDELTLRAGEAGSLRAFINTANMEIGRCGPPLVDEDGHASQQAIHKRRRASGMGVVEMNREVNVCDPSGSTKAKKPWKMRDAKNRPNLRSEN